MTHGYGGSTTVIGEGAASEPPAAEVRSARWRPASGMTVQFWGVRGSLACPEPEVARYGGNTSCVEVRCGDRLLIFDAGTGLRLWAGNLLPSRRIVQAIGQMMSEPLFPLGPDSFKAAIEFHDFYAGDVLKPHPGMTLRTAPLNHPGGATGYRLEYGKSAIAYITDTEHRPGALDKDVLQLARDVDLMIYDCNYTEEEYPAHVGWGHSTWQQGVRLANAAGAKLLAIFHHDPEHVDALLDRIGREAKAQRADTLVAAEGLALRF